MAAKIKKGDKVVVLTGRDKGRTGEVRQVMPDEGRAIVAGVNLVKRHTAPDRADRRRHPDQGGADPSVEPGDRRSQDRQADARRLQDSRRRPQGPRRQAFRRPDRWLRQRTRRAPSRPRAKKPPRRRAGRARRPRPAEAKGAKGRKEAASGVAAAGSVKAAPKDYVARLKKLYQDEIVPKLVKEFGYKNALEVPRIDKIVLNMGVGEAVNDTKKVTSAAADLALIAGQKPVITRARKAISTFKVRENMPIGAKVTLRKTRMYEFLDRLVTVALPRVRDFRGLDPKSFDGRGNYALGDQGAHHVPRDRLRQGGSDAWAGRRGLHDGEDRRGSAGSAARVQLPVPAVS